MGLPLLLHPRRHQGKPPRTPDSTVVAATLIDEKTGVTASATTAASITTVALAAGDQLVLKRAREGGTASGTWNTPTAAGLTWTPRAQVFTASRCQVEIWTSSPLSGAGAVTVSSGTTTVAQAKSMVVEAWRGAAVFDGTEAVLQLTAASGFPDFHLLTTTRDNSAVTWTDGDWSAAAPGTPAYRGGATQQLLHDVSPGNYVGYHARQSTPLAGPQRVGVGSPSAGQAWSLVALEVRGTTSAGGSVTGAGSATAAPVTAAGAGASTATGSGAASGSTATAQGAASVRATGAGSAAATAGSASGAGMAITSGSGSAAAPTGAAAGAGSTSSPSVAGAGAASAASGQAAGSGVARTTGSGSTSTPAGSAAGAGTARATGQGAATAAPGVSSAGGQAVATGSGAATGGAGLASGTTGTPTASGSGAPSAAAGAAAGTGGASTGAAGAAVTPSAAAQGSGTASTTGTGAATAPAAVVDAEGRVIDPSAAVDVEVISVETRWRTVELDARLRSIPLEVRMGPESVTHRQRHVVFEERP